MKEFISVEEARELVGERLEGLAQQWLHEEVDLPEALYRRSAVDVHSTEDFPPFDNSAMDGFAVRATDAKRPELHIIGESRAGMPWTGHLGPGECIRISTGAAIPAGADAIVPLEWTASEEADRLKLRLFPSAGQNVRPSGADLERGQLVLRGGEIVTPAMVMLLAMIGRSRLAVARRPTVAILSTGDELRPPETPPPLEYGFIRDSNGPGLDALVREAGGQTLHREVVPDRAEALLGAVRKLLDADVSILTGGISVGPHDHVRSVLGEAGAEIVFWRIRQRPGKPMAFALLEGRPVFCLPGNPVSAAVCFWQYVKPALRQLMGCKPEPPDLAWARATDAIAKAPGLHHFVRGVATFGEDGGVRVATTGAQTSNLVSSITRANCLIHLEEPRADVSAGEIVPIEWMRGPG